MRGLGDFILSEGVRYRDLQLASDDLVPRKAAGSSDRGLDGWSFLMRTPRAGPRDTCTSRTGRRARGHAGGRRTAATASPGTTRARGAWADSLDLTADAAGVLQLPPFPGGEEVASTDWAARVVAH